MRKIVVLGGLVALAAVARRALRRSPEWETPSLLPAAPPSGAQPEAALAPAGVTEAVPPPPDRKPSSEADPTDREIESRLDDETKYDRLREQEEAARHEAAERLRNDPLLERGTGDAGP